MNQLTVITALLALVQLPITLCAAEVWESKPFQDWSEKDLQKVSGHSPWARQTRAVIAHGATGGPGRSAPPPAVPGRSVPPSAVEDASASNSVIGPGGRAGSAGGLDRLGTAPSELDQGRQTTQPPGVPILIRWQTALPLRQAQMRAKYGKEAATSPEARKFLAQEPALYLVAISGLPGAVVSGGAGDQARERIAKSTTLTPRGKEPIRPLGVEFVPNGQGVDVLIGFPRSAPIALDDQEVELTSQIGTASVKYKFKLKDMVSRGKLEL